MLAEIEYGIAKSARKEHNRQVFAALLAGFVVLPFDEPAARECGLLRADLQRAGCLIGPNDLMIAAHARALRLAVVTDNSDEFGRVNGLNVENWLRQPPA